MRKIGTSLVLVASLFVGTGCGGGSSGDGTNISAALQACVGDGMGYLLGIASSVRLIDQILSGNIPEDPNTTVTEVNGLEYTYDYRIGLDLDNDGLFDSVISGRIAYSEDPTDGIDSGDEASLTWTASGSEGLAGSGNLQFEYINPVSILVYGDGSIDLPGNCGLDYDIPDFAPMTFGFPVIAAVNLLGGETFGTLDVIAFYKSHTLEAQVELAQGSNIISILNPEIDDVDVEDIEFELDVDEETYFGLALCAFVHTELTFSILEEIVYAFETDVNGTEYDRGTLDITTTGTFEADFSITFDSDRIFDAGDTIVGHMAFNQDPLPGSTVIVTINFTFNAFASAFRATSGPINPLQAVITLNGPQGEVDIDTEELSGSSWCRITEDTPILVQEGDVQICTATLTIPDSDPIQIAELSEFGIQGGSLTLESAFGGHTGRFALVIHDDESATARSYFDGIPVPNDILFLFGLIDD